MDIKFILLMTGLFLFTLGYVNQNKYNCNIIPSLNKLQEQDLKNLFYDNNIFMDNNNNNNNKIYDYDIRGTKTESNEFRQSSSLGRFNRNGNSFNFTTSN